MNEERTTSRKTRVGKVVSDKMDKTVVVIVEDRVAHKTYKKIIGRTYRLQVRRRRYRPRDGDPPPVQGQEMARGRDRREG